MHRGSGRWLTEDYRYITEASEIEEVLPNILESRIAGVDTETTGLDPHLDKLRLLQIATPNNPIYLFDFFKLDKGIKLLDKFFSSSIVKIFHNCKFDLQMLWAAGLYEKPPLFDTMLASMVLNGGLEGVRHNLKAVSERFLNIEVDKTEQRSDWTRGVLTESQLSYAAKDSRVLLNLYHIQRALLIQNLLVETAAIEFNCAPATAMMEYTGIYLDLEQWNALLPVYIDKRQKAQEEFGASIVSVPGQFNLFGGMDYAINIASAKQVLKKFHELKLPDPLGINQYINSTDQTVVGLLDEKGYPVIKPYLDYKHANQRINSFIRKLPKCVNKATGRIHSGFSQMGAGTGRFSNEKPNQQQIPRTSDFRSCFKPEGDNYFVISDYCLAAGTRIATHKGLVPIEVCSDQLAVYQDDNSLKPITRLIERGIQSVKTIQTNLGYSFTCTDNHRIKVLRNDEYIWIETKDLDIVNDYVVITAGRGFNLVEDYYSLPEVSYNHVNNKQIQTPKYADEKFAEFVGYLSGDGSFPVSGISWVVCDKDEDLNSYLKNYVESTFGLITGESEYRGVFQSQFHSRPLATWMRHLGISKVTVPEFVYNSKASVVAAYLRGLFESDGSVTDRVTFCTTDRDFSIEIQQLLLSLGILCKRKKAFKNRLATKDPYHIEILSAFSHIFESSIGFISPRKQGRLSKLNETSGFSSTYGSIPLSYEFIKSLVTEQKDKNLLKNSLYTNRRPISLRTAYLLQAQNEELSKKLGTYRTTEYLQYYDRVVSIEDTGTSLCYDLEVPESNLFIANGFVSHNSQVEIRIMAQIAKEPAMITEYKKGAEADLHSLTAAIIKGLTLEQFAQLSPTERKEARQQAKAVNFGFLYGMGPYKFKNYAKSNYGVTLTEAQASDFRKKYFNVYKEVLKLHKRVAKYADTCTETRTLANRLIKWSSPPGLSAIVNAPVQGTSADITKTALGMIYRELRDNNIDGRLVTTVHDEIVMEFSKDVPQEMALALLSGCMEKAGQKYIDLVPVIADAGICSSWADK